MLPEPCCADITAALRGDTNLVGLANTHPATPRAAAARDARGILRTAATRGAGPIRRKTRCACRTDCRPSKPSHFVGAPWTPWWRRAKPCRQNRAVRGQDVNLGAVERPVRAPPGMQHHTPIALDVNRSHPHHPSPPPNCQITTRLGHFLRAPRPKDGTMVGTTPTSAATPGRSAIPRHQLLHSTHHPPELRHFYDPPWCPCTPTPHTHPGGLHPHRELYVALLPYKYRSQVAHPISSHPLTPHPHPPTPTL